MPRVRSTCPLLAIAVLAFAGAPASAATPGIGIVLDEFFLEAGSHENAVAGNSVTATGFDASSWETPRAATASRATSPLAAA